VNISFVGSDALAKELGPAGAGVVITQVVPFPKDAAIPVVGRYQASLKASVPDAQPASSRLRAYLVAARSSRRSKRSMANPRGKAWFEAVQKAGTFDLGGFKLVYSDSSNRGSDHVFLTVIQADGSFKAVDRLEKPGT